jgi:hypothetical protein
METHETFHFYSVHENLSKKSTFVCTTLSRTDIYPQQVHHIFFIEILEYSHENLSPMES